MYQWLGLGLFVKYNVWLSFFLFYFLTAFNERKKKNRNSKPSLVYSFFYFSHISQPMSLHFPLWPVGVSTSQSDSEQPAKKKKLDSEHTCSTVSTWAKEDKINSFLLIYPKNRRNTWRNLERNILFMTCKCRDSILHVTRSFWATLC